MCLPHPTRSLERQYWGREFARKLIRPFGSVTKEDIEYEVKAITDICASGGHRHVIQFLIHGPLPASD
jgi:hypothetical protein